MHDSPQTSQHYSTAFRVKMEEGAHFLSKRVQRLNRTWGRVSKTTPSKKVIHRNWGKLIQNPKNQTKRNYTDCLIKKVTTTLKTPS